MKISIIMPVYNAEKHIREALESVVKQTVSDTEIICIDDGSTDGSESIIKEFSEKLPALVLIKQENRGAGAARNAGLDCARGKYVCFLDSDDYYPEKNTLEKLYNAAEKSEANICGGSFSRDLNGKIITHFEGISKAYTFDSEGFIRYSDYQWEYGYHRFLYKLEFLRENNITFPRYLRYQDPPFFVRAMINSEKFYAIPDIVYRYRVNPKKVLWNEKKVRDLIFGLTDNLIMARENGLWKLYETTIERVEHEYCRVIAQQTDSEAVVHALMKLNSEIESSRCNDENRIVILTPLKLLCNGKNVADECDYKEKYETLIGSRRYKLGQLLTLPVAFLKRVINK